MNSWISRAVILLLSLMTNSAFAEGNCPPGYYPIGGQGVQGCAPIGGAAASPAQSMPVPAPRPSGEWIKTWGALAKSSGSDLVGASNGELSRKEAEQLATERCAAEGAKDCSVSFTYMNQCMAYAVPSSGKGMAMLSRGPTRQAAHQEAVKYCQDSKGGSCDIAYSACAEPHFRSF